MTISPASGVQRTTDVISSVHFDAGKRILTDTQHTALDLYERGFNVIPVKPHLKESYILRPFFTSRLHHCSADCKHAGRNDIAELFKRRNIGIMTGRTSGNLLAIDCDSHVAFRKIGKELTTRALPFWAITGSRGGTYLLRILEGEAASIPGGKSIFQDVEIWGNRRLIVMPPSIHSSGVVYQWATPEPRFHFLNKHETLQVLSITDLEWLGVQLLTDVRPQWEEPDLFGLPRWAAALSRPNREAFASQVPEGQRNTVLTAFAYDMAGNQIDYSEAERVTLDFAQRTGLPKRDALATLKSAYSQDREPARKDGDGLRAWQRAKAFAESFDWRAEFGRRSLKVHAVFMACVERARRDGRETWRATAREVGELANCNKETAAILLRELAKHKLVKRTNNRPEDRKEAGLYRFVYPSKFRTLYTPCSCSVRNLDTPKTQAEQDIFGALGLVSWRVWKHLHGTTEPSAGSISRALNLPRSSVCEAVRRLDGLGMVARGGDGHYYAEARTEASLQYLATQLFDSDSKSQSRKAAHRLERERAVNRAVTKAIEYFESQSVKGGKHE